MTWHRRPRHLHHVGQIITSTVWVPETGGRPAAESRVWAWWGPSVRVERSTIGFLLRLPEPVPVDGRDGVLPLVAIRGRWCAAPFDPRDVERHPVGAVLVVRGFEIVSVPPEGWEAVDLSEWLDVAPLQIEEVRPLGPPPAPPVEIAAPIRRDPRAALGVPDAAAGSTALAQALATRSGSGAGLGNVGASVAARGLSWLARLGRWLAPTGGSAAPETGERPGAAAPPARSGGWLDWMETLSRRLGMSSALGRWVGSQHARYLQRMMSMFDAGDWDDALKHAIPLSDAPGAPSGGGWLSWLGPRQGMALSGRSVAGTGRSVGLGEELFGMLQQMYERAFRSLDGAGRVREAAYVLAELLDDGERAVTYLEEHGETRLAAEFAEAKELSAPRVVRLWFQAGDIERAVVLARRHGAFAEAVAALENRDESAMAVALRSIWAAQEADAGRFAAAAQILWPVERLRDQARDWLRSSMRVPGIAGAQALGRFVTWCPEERETATEALASLLAAPRAAQARWTLARTLIDGDTRDLPRWAVLPLARELLRDLRERPDVAAKKTLGTLVAKTDAGGFDADLPHLPTQRVPVPVPLARREDQTFDLARGDVGTVRIHDVVPLPGDRWLVALGELGLRVITRDGRTVRQYATPATALVLGPDDALLVLVVAFRGELARVSRIEVGTGRLRPWVDVPIRGFARAFDGHQWFVHDADRVFALDVHAESSRATWSVPDLGAMSIAVSDSELQVLDQTSELYRYRLPQLSLSSRAQPGETSRLSQHAGLHVCGNAQVFHREFPIPGARFLALCDAFAAVTVLGGADNSDWTVAITRGLDRDIVRCATVQSPGASWVGVRWVGPDLAVFDDRGRLRVIDASTGELRLDVRV